MRVTDAVLMVCILIIGWSFYRAHRDPRIDFNLLDLLLENDRVSKKSVLVMGAFAASTWIVIRLTLDGKLTEGYFTAYMAAWVAPMIAGMFATNTPPPPPAVVTTVTATQTTTTPADKDPKP